jgi:hypothetical protein
VQTRITTAVAVLAALGLCSAGIAGCGDDDADAAAQGDTGASAEATDSGLVKCPDNLPEFAATPTGGLEAMVTHKTLKARLIAASPLHPTVGAMNNWTVQFSDTNDMPLDGLEIVESCAWMAVHNHGNEPLKGHKMLSAPGQFEFDYLNLFMRGPWEFQLVVNRSKADAGDASTGADSGAAKPMEYAGCDRYKQHPGTEYAVFNFCVKNE